MIERENELKVIREWVEKYDRISKDPQHF